MDGAMKPTRQGSQTDTLANVPIAHGVQPVDDAGATDPAGHDSHVFGPLANVPSAHGVHESEETELIDPEAQGVQTVRSAEL